MICYPFLCFVLKVEENVQRKDGDISDLTSKKNSILVNHGKLQQEAEVQLVIVIALLLCLVFTLV